MCRLVMVKYKKRARHKENRHEKTFYAGRTYDDWRALSDEERQIAVLHAVSGMKFREIAELLGLPLSTVLSKYHRSMKRLRDLWQEGETKK